jgi:hypothetical protein
MEIMFHMMNEVRLEVGTQAATHASCAYLYALDYARTRCQGRSLEAGRDSSAPQVPIIQHPDVRRMLTRMKAYVEGMRSLLYYTAFCIDKGHCADTQADKDRYQGLTEILTPVVKAYCSERGFDVCVEAMQVFGGYGYTREYPMEQLVRDCKICSIYEGANGIQAMDFLGRKLTLAKGAFLASLVDEIKKTAQRAMETEGLEEMGEKVMAAAALLETTCTQTAQGIRGQKFKSAFAFAHPLLEATGDVVMAWMLLWRANVAQPPLDEILNRSNANSLDEILGASKNAAFYHGKVTTAEFFINTLLPATMGKLQAIAQGTSPAVTMHANSF